VIPQEGFPTDGSEFELELKDGRKIPTNLVIPATGQTPNNQFLHDLQPTPGHKILNSANGFIKVLPTLQFADPSYSNLYACGDIADSGAHKAARPGSAQALVVAQNIAAMVQGGKPTNEITVDPPAIHLSLGLVSRSNLMIKSQC
jgi:NADH dehydrogenase FAD-containing subunit